MPWKPSFPGEVPTLGFLMIDWYREMLAAPDRADYEPFVLYTEQEDFILRWYEIDPITGKFKYFRGVLGRPRGWGKSPLLGAVAIGEALGPVVFDGWDANGQPVGRPWSMTRTPIVHVAAVSEEQTENTWQPLMEMVGESAPIHDHYFVQPYDSHVQLAGTGKIKKLTSSARTQKGGKPVFVVMDQTEEWVPANGGTKLAKTLMSNAGKVGGRVLESPNAYTPGEDSVAEASAQYLMDIEAGRAKDEGLLYDHREAPGSTDMSDYDSLLLGLRIAYGDSSNHPDGCLIHDPACPPGHADLERNIRTIWDPAFDSQTARSDYLNQITHHADAWTNQEELHAITDEDLQLHDGDVIVAGFDGSRGRNRGNADATAIVLIRVADGATFELRVWQPAKGDKTWVSPIIEVDAVVRMMFERWKVVGFYADPSGWAEQVARWEAKYGRKLKVKASQNFPIAAWPKGKDTRVSEYLENLRKAIVTGEVSVSAAAPNIIAHSLHARVRREKNNPNKYKIVKAYPDSPDKIDAAYAWCMAYKAYIDSLAAGVGGRIHAVRVVDRETNRRGRVVIS